MDSAVLMGPSMLSSMAQHSAIQVSMGWNIAEPMTKASHQHAAVYQHR
eukprot:CAMPEP_0119328184 /NCGR_PEP_ID=MMETSP1333-20130426/72687_1 /TAXON_ID=418940 /ORGANISM="Scyphosphaera apsteinii, Strain RCC1455" /LENGTH=47 /DNA_ID= /DNA_START= /DNA_END= /DNA_ORIENTATION=